MSTELIKIAMVAVISSQIAAIGYDQESKTLRITFADRKDGSLGSSYDYANVEPETHKALVEAESVGSYFYKTIKPDPLKYPFKKLAGHYPAPAPANVAEQETTS